MNYLQDSNFWFYTLSAIPQTLAAMIALAATFVVFKLSKIEESISSHIYHIKIILRSISHKGIPKEDNPDTFLKLFGNVIDSESDEWVKNNRNRLSTAYKEIVRDTYLRHTGGEAQPDEIKDWLNYQIKEDFRQKVVGKKAMFSYLWQTLTIVSFTIIFCLVFLPAFGALSERSMISIISLSVGLAGGSIAATATSIFKVTKL